MTVRILTVCTGNICRSAMAKMVFEQRFAADGLDVKLDSCGISDEERGNPIDPRAAQVLRDAGYQVTTHRARQVKQGELHKFDLVLAATRGHKNRLCAYHPKEAERVQLMRDFDTEGVGDNMPDPWYGDMDDFVETLATIERIYPQLADWVRSVSR